MIIFYLILIYIIQFYILYLYLHICNRLYVPYYLHKNISSLTTLIKILNKDFKFITNLEKVNINKKEVILYFIINIIPIFGLSLSIASIIYNLGEYIYIPKKSKNQLKLYKVLNYLENEII